METPAKVEQRTFYSRCANLIIGSAIPGKLEEINGRKVMHGETAIEFTPVGQMSYGAFSTNDPRLVAVLEKRMAEQGESADILTPEQFQAEVQAKRLIDDPKYAARVIQENNRLMGLLAEQGKLGKEATVRK